MKKWHMIIDVKKCEGCHNCFMACKDEYIDNEWPGYSKPLPPHGHRWVKIEYNERGQYPIIDVAYLPMMCMHCDNAPCIKDSGGSVQKRADGIVIIDPIKAKGQRELVKACPYGLITWNEEENIPQKCTFCAHLLDDGWKEPRCVQACPGGALRVEYVEDIEMDRIINEEKLEVLHPEYNTRPRVYYKNLYRFNKCFIAGTIEVSKNGIVDCLEGGKIALFCGEEKINETTSDNFGDFKIDNLPENSGEYVLEISYAGNQKKITIDLHSSINVGTIHF